MNRYQIFCTPEQTKKALELGAPIKAATFTRPGDGKKVVEIGEYNLYSIPTAEQMIGWIEEQGSITDIGIYLVFQWGYYIYNGKYCIKNNNGKYLTRKEATLAAIDAALEYLSNNNK